MSSRLPLIAIVVAILLFLGWSSIFVVNARQQAIVLRFGEIVDVKSEPGIYFKAPFPFLEADNVQIIENRIMRFDLDDLRVQVSGGKFYEVDAFVAYRISNPRVFRLAVSGSVPLADKPHHVEDLKTFCATFLNGRGPLRTRPYIADCSDAEVGRVADGHDAALRWLTAHVNGAAQQLASLPERDEEPGSGALPDALTQFAETVVSDQVAPPGHEAPRK